MATKRYQFLQLPYYLLTSFTLVQWCPTLQYHWRAEWPGATMCHSDTWPVCICHAECMWYRRNVCMYVHPLCKMKWMVGFVRGWSREFVGRSAWPLNGLVWLDKSSMQSMIASSLSNNYYSNVSMTMQALSSGNQLGFLLKLNGYHMGCNLTEANRTDRHASAPLLPTWDLGKQP